MAMTVTMFAIAGFKQIGKSNHAVREKAAGLEETKQQAELFEMLEQNFQF